MGARSCHFSCINIDVIIDASGERCLVVESILQIVRYLTLWVVVVGDSGTHSATVDLEKKRFKLNFHHFVQIKTSLPDLKVTSHAYINIYFHKENTEYRIKY